MSFRIFLFQNEWKSLKRLFHVCSFVKSKAQLLHWLLPHNYLLLQGYNMIPWNGQKVDRKRKRKGWDLDFSYCIYYIVCICFVLYTHDFYTLSTIHVTVLHITDKIPQIRNLLNKCPWIFFPISHFLNFKTRRKLSIL